MKLYELAVGPKPTYNSISIDQAIKILTTDCSDFLKSFMAKNWFYRGDDENKFSASTVDTSLTTRKSQNSQNFYTSIIDNSPAWEGFPKRSKSLICSKSYHRANGYITGTNSVKVLIPYNSAKIGEVNSKDIWDKKINLFGRNSKINHLNDDFSALVSDILEIYLRADEWKHLVQIDKILKSGDAKAIKIFKYTFTQASEKHVNSFLESIIEAYSPKALNMDWSVPKEHKIEKNNFEYWIQGKILLLDEKTAGMALETLSEREER